MSKPATHALISMIVYLLSVIQPCMAATIVLDPGHGGDDNGAKSQSAYFEKQYTLALAQKTAQLLASAHRVEMTRNSDVAVSIVDRAGMANQLKADAMISLHAAVAPYCDTRKAAVYFHDDDRLVFPPGLGTQGQADESVNVNPDWAKLQAAHQPQSRLLASLIKQSLLQVGAYDHVSVAGVPLAILMGADLPAVIIEVGCMRPAMADSDAKINDEIDKLAQSIAEAVNLAMARLRP